jgi:flavin reductase (DIM6/NTAB) family NADH-FMN oxidoreductase RutF
MDEAAKKTALRMVPYGLYVGGTHDGPQVHAFLLSWFSQCSFKPPLVMAGIKVDSKAHALILRSKTFSVNLLDSSQKMVAASFLKHAVVEGDKLSGHPYQLGKTGCPILDEAAAWVECRVVHHWSHGDHTVMVAEVVEAGVRRATDSLSHADTGWHYGG